MFEEPRVPAIIRAKGSAFRSRIQTLEIENSRNFLDARRFLNSIKFPVIGHIRNKLINQNNNANAKVNVKKRITRRRKCEKKLAATPPTPRYSGLKVNIVMFAEFKRNEEYQVKNFKTSNEIITPASNLDEFYEEAVQNILSEMEVFEMRGSQWVLNQILNLELRINKYNQLRGRSYMPLPPTLANKKAIINVKNKDNKCFLWAVLSALHPAGKNAQRVTKYKQWEYDFDFTLKDFEYPCKVIRCV